jgi:hypothetical protein
MLINTALFVTRAHVHIDIHCLHICFRGRVGLVIKTSNRNYPENGCAMLANPYDHQGHLTQSIQLPLSDFLKVTFNVPDLSRSCEALICRTLALQLITVRIQ